MGDTVILRHDKPDRMTLAPETPEQMLGVAALAAREGGSALQTALEALPMPVYLTDADGWITYYNRACVDFAGRTPIAGEDRWCVTWKLFQEDGRPLRHEDCPMAVAIREKREVRGAVALAERPDGRRIMFVPYPTPLHDEAGDFTGAVNILIDVSDPRQAQALRAQAQRCRRLAQAMTDRQAIDALEAMAGEYEAKAGALDGAPRG